MIDGRGNDSPDLESDSEHEVTVLVARAVVAKMAPQELPLFKGNADAYFTDRDRALSQARAADDMLGFGAGEVVALMTPYVLDVVRDVLQFFADELKGAVREKGKGVFGAILRIFRRRDATAESVETSSPQQADAAVEDDEPIRPTADDLARMRELAIEKAGLLGLSKKNQELLADSIVASLAMG